MRKVILFMSVSLDGFIEGPERQIDWHQVDASRERRVGGRAGDLDEVGGGFAHEPLEGVAGSKRRSAGGRADAGAVLGDAMEIDCDAPHSQR